MSSGGSGGVLNLDIRYHKNEFISNVLNNTSSITHLLFFTHAAFPHQMNGQIYYNTNPTRMNDTRSSISVTTGAINTRSGGIFMTGDPVVGHRPT